MQPVDEQKVREAIRMLDQEVPREGAKVRLRQYGGGPDEGELIANQKGYLRLGIECLKAAFGPTKGDANSGGVEVDLEYLVTNDSTINFDWFERREMELMKPEIAKSSGWLVGIAILIVFVVLGVFTLIGIGTVISWLAA
jgi:hypothetical protein